MLDQISTFAVELLIDSAIKTTVFLLLAVPVGWWLARRCPTWHALFWNAALLALLLIPIASLCLPGLRVPVWPEEHESTSLSEFPPSDPSHHLSWGSGEFLEDPPPLASEGQHPSQVSPDSDPPLSLDLLYRFASQLGGRTESLFRQHWPFLVLLLFLAGFVVVLARTVAGYWNAGRLHRSTRSLGHSWQTARLSHWRRRLGVRQPVDLGASDRACIPTVVGILRPLIVMPIHLADTTDARVLDSILVHELAHIKRRDPLWNLLNLLVAACYWFHPLVYLAYRSLSEAREYACDDWAVETLGNSRQYAAALLEVTSRTDRKHVMALGLDMARTVRIVARISRVINLGSHVVVRTGRLTAVATVTAVLSASTLFGSLHLTDSRTGRVVYSQERMSVRTATEAAARLRALYFMQDFEGGYYEGRDLIARFAHAPELRAWYVANVARSDVGYSRAREAVAVADDMVGSDAENPWGWFARAHALSKSRIRREEAFDASGKAMDLQPDHPDIIWLWASALLASGRQEDAITFVDRNRPRVNNLAELLVIKGRALYSLSENPRAEGQRDELKVRAAFAALEEARTTDPLCVNAYYYAGRYLAASGDNAKGCALLRRALALSPNAGSVHQAFCLAVGGHTEMDSEQKLAEIEADVREFIRSRGHYPGTLYTVSDLYRRLGLAEEQAAVEKQIFQAFPDSPEAEWVQVRRYQQAREAMRREATPSAVQEERYIRSLAAFVNRPSHQDKRLLADAYQELSLFVLRQRRRR